MKKFTRTTENFTCAHCGADVLGNGYTNHCPKCLWSRHVDNNPGDRQSECGGMMRPESIIIENGEYKIIHKCEKCGKTIKQRTSENDDMDTIIAISSNPDFVYGKQSLAFSGRNESVKHRVTRERVALKFRMELSRNKKSK